MILGIRLRGRSGKLPTYLNFHYYSLTTLTPFHWKIGV